MKKQTYDLEERLLEYSVRIIKTEELIKIFVTSINTAVKKQKKVLNVWHWRLVFHSTLDVGCSMFDVHLSKQPCMAQM